MKHSILLIILILSACHFAAIAQTRNDRDMTSSTMLDTVTIRGLIDTKQHLPAIYGVHIFAGKKTDLIDLNSGEANLPQNLGRMIFAKTPGINLWDMDGAGTQLNIGTRGTDAHRSIEMNMRQNGYNTNSDMFGYPENHYTVPMQGVRQIQLVRGSAALQFGSQFGGMMNYVMKEGDSTKVFSLESEQTAGAYNFYNSYNAIGGKKGKVSYYAYYDNRHGDGWRPNAAFNYQSFYASIKYQFSKKGSIAFQFSRMNYRQQIAGGLTDDMFHQNARQSNRARNYFSPTINIPALILQYDLSSRTHLQITSNILWGDRSSVQFINPPNVADTINTTLGSYNPRQVDRDYYNGFTTEARLLHRYQLRGMRSTIAGGLRYFNETTKRRQKGKGTTASDFDFSLTGPYGIDLKFNTVNYAVFVENTFQLTQKFSITPGFRYEVINSQLDGVINNATFPVSYKGNRTFPLFGVGLQYQVTDHSQFYGNISQAYRPYLYAQVTPADQLSIIDPNLKDSKGYDIDAGYRGQLLNIVNFDVNGFYLFYGNKIGNVVMKDNKNNPYLLTTNIGNFVSKGVEAYVNISLWKLVTGANHNTDIRVFNSLAYTHARYTTDSIAPLTGKEKNVRLKDNYVENTPEWNNRAGLEFQHKGFTSTVQMSYVSRQFSDAQNTSSISTGVVGVIPSYTLWDWSFNWSFMKLYHVAGGINNITDARYFSRRINMYPGPGILPADGRTFYVTIGFKI